MHAMCWQSVFNVNFKFLKNTFISCQEAVERLIMNYSKNILKNESNFSKNFELFKTYKNLLFLDNPKKLSRHLNFRKKQFFMSFEENLIRVICDDLLL